MGIGSGVREVVGRWFWVRTGGKRFFFLVFWGIITVVRISLTDRRYDLIRELIVSDVLFVA